MKGWSPSNPLDTDGLPGEPMIEFRCANLRSDRPVLEHPADVFIGVTADLSILTDSGPIYSEPDFPVVELAVELNAWVEDMDGSNFELHSMETPEPGWVWIRQSGNGWRVGSIHQEHDDPVDHDLEEVRSAIHRFLSHLEFDLAQRFNLSLRRVISMEDGPR